jgi:HAE1 family hydrophobic/amphiphilic exporter-1
VIIGLSIPISVVATFILIYFADITLNMMTLGGIALGIGMLVDNSVVVLENIYRFMQEGYSKVEAAVKGAKEVAMSVTASTLTTIAVFLPMVFTEGITSIMFKELALTVTFSLVSSLVVSLTLIPMLCSVILKVDTMQGKHHVTKFKLMGAILDKTDKLYTAVESGYKSLLDWALRHRKTVALFAVLLLVVGFGSIAFIGTEYMAATDEGLFSVEVELENGAKAADTSAIIDEIVEKIIDIEEIDYLFSNTDSGSLFGDSQNTGTIQGVLVDMSDRDKSTFEVVSLVEEKIGDIPGAKISVSAQSSMAMMTGGSEISISIKGDDLDMLEALSIELQDIVSQVEGTKNVTTSLSDAIPQVEISLKTDRASKYGLTTYQVANAVKAVVDGRTATTYKLDGNELDVVIEGDDLYSESISNLKQVSIQTPTGAVVPLELVADVYIDLGPTEIDREDQSRVVTVSCDTDGRDLGSVTSDINDFIDSDLELPTGYLIEMGGQNQEMIEAFSDLGLALVLAVLLIYMVLASQFESLLMPFIIMFTTPLAFAGGLLGLFITGRTINIVSIIGFIMLSGIVVNNAIVLIDYINTRRKFGEERDEAIKNAGPIRLRPIMMTTLTTVLGLTPMALGFGEGAEMTSPMATVVIFGLLLGTLLTLVFIPVVYSVFDDIMKKRKKQLEIVD